MQKYIRRWFVRVMEYGYGKAVVQVHDGINICDLASSERGQEEQWRDRIIGALELIHNHDPRRYGRVRRHIRYIINHACLGWGHYDCVLQSCQVDFPKFRHLQNLDWCLLLLARVLIHEATHAEIYSQNIPLTSVNRLRIEHLCYAEETRFVRRVRPDLDLPDFDDAWHRELYGQGVWQRLIRSFKRFRQRDQPVTKTLW